MKEKIFDFSDISITDSKNIDNIAEEIRDDYIDYLTRIGKAYEHDINWWMLNFVSRNTFISPLFFYICCLIMLKKRFAEGHNYDRIIVNSNALMETLSDFKAENSLSFQLIYRGKNKFHNKLFRISNYLKVLVHFSLKWFFSKVTWKYKKRINMEKQLSLIDVFVFKNSFNNGLYKDRYYPGLLDYINSSKKESIYYCPTFFGIKNYWKIFLEVRKSSDNFLLKEDYLRINDYFYSVTLFMRLKKFLFKNLNFKGINIKSMVNEEILNDSVSNSTMYGILNYKFVNRLKAKGTKIKTVINWFENQTISHGFNYGFNEYYPSAYLVGYQGFPLANNYLSLYPIVQEFRNKVIPEVIYVIGKGYINQSKKYCSDLI